MKKFLQSNCLLTASLTCFLVVITFSGVHAQSSISGDDVCGGLSNKCTLDSLKPVAKGILKAVVAIGLPALVIFIAYRLVAAWFALQQGNANAYKEALSKITQALIGFIIIVALFGGVFMSMLKFVGVQNFPLTLLKLISEVVVPHAYAATGLPNPLGVNDLYSFILSVLRLVMRFFIYPAFIVMWAWTGLQFVMAEGNPDALSKAKKWLLWAFVSTVVVMMLQGFLLAVQTSVNKIFSEKATTSLYIRS